MKRYLLSALLFAAVFVLAISFIPAKQERQYYYAFDERFL